MMIVLKPYKVTIDVIVVSRFAGKNFGVKRNKEQAFCYVRARNRREAFFGAIHHIEDSGIKPYHIITKVKVRRMFTTKVAFVIH